MDRLHVITVVLLFLLAIPIGLWFVMYDNRFEFKELLPYRGFWLSWGSSAAVAFLALLVVTYTTGWLHSRWPWRGTALRWVAQGALQALLGWAVPLVLLWAWNAGLFYGRGQTLRLEDYAEGEFRVAAILLAVFNVVCCVVLAAWQGIVARVGRMGGAGGADVAALTDEVEDTGADIVASAGVDVSDLVENCAYIEVSGRTCIVYRMDGGKEAYAMTLDAFERLLDGPQFCRIFRNHIVNRKAIRSWEFVARKRKCTVMLHPPYDGVQLRVGQRYQRAFLKWVDSN